MQRLGGGGKEIRAQGQPELRETLAERGRVLGEKERICRFKEYIL